MCGSKAANNSACTTMSASRQHTRELGSSHLQQVVHGRGSSKAMLASARWLASLLMPNAGSQLVCYDSWAPHHTTPLTRVSVTTLCQPLWLQHPVC